MVIKKGVLLLVFVVLFSNFVLASDVGYILKYERNAKPEILNVFSDLGLEVDLIEDVNVNRVNLGSYDMLFIDDAILRNTKKLPVYNYPSVIMNGYYGNEWGLTDIDGTSQLASTAPLNVRLVDNGVRQVYTQAKFPSGVSIPYNYLHDENKAAGFQGIARTYTGNVYAFGDVIAVIDKGERLVNGKRAGGNICYYGISETKYWTSHAKNLFIDCVESVLVECKQDLECGEDFCEDFGDNYCKDDDVYRSRECHDFSCVSGGCEENINLNETKVEECGLEGCENGECIEPPIECFVDEDCDDENEGTIDTCHNPGTTESFCTNEEQVTCFVDEDCGIDGFIDGLYCEGAFNKDVYQNFREWECENPGTSQSSCSQEITSKLVNECSDTCTAGACVDIPCFVDDDCDDENEETIDICNNPGTINSFCSHAGILCSQNSDCGSDRFVGDLYCSGDDIHRDFKEFSCNNPGQENSFCSNDVNSEFLFSCNYACANGFCVRCNENLDCDDEDYSTEDICWFSGTGNSYCTHEHIECFEDLDCGEDSFIDGLYCIDDDVYQDYRTFECVNPETPGSYCNADSEPRLIESCDFGCAGGECLEGVHDVAIIENSEFIDGIRIKDKNSDEVLLDEIPVLDCNGSYEIKFRTENQGNFYENISFNSELKQDSVVIDDWIPSDKENLAPGDTTDRSTSTQFDFASLISGLYRIIAEAIISIDDDLENNFAEREIEVVCGEECIPEVEVCNGLDDDCNEEIDENIENITSDIFGYDNIGECREQIESCVEGSFEIIQEAVGPEDEICNDNLDNDCDELIDCEDSDCDEDVSCKECEKFEQMIYAQDGWGVGDKAKIWDRTSELIHKQGQIKDNYVIWNKNIDIGVFEGESLLYEERGRLVRGNLSVEFLDLNKSVYDSIFFELDNETATIAQDGYIRFPEGSVADEYNRLVLKRECLVA